MQANERLIAAEAEAAALRSELSARTLRAQELEREQRENDNRIRELAGGWNLSGLVKIAERRAHRERFPRVPGPSDTGNDDRIIAVDNDFITTSTLYRDYRWRRSDGQRAGTKHGVAKSWAHKLNVADCLRAWNEWVATYGHPTEQRGKS